MICIAATNHSISDVGRYGDYQGKISIELNGQRWLKKYTKVERHFVFRHLKTITSSGVIKVTTFTI